MSKGANITQYFGKNLNKYHEINSPELKMGLHAYGVSSPTNSNNLGKNYL